MESKTFSLNIGNNVRKSRGPSTILNEKLISLNNNMPLFDALNWYSRFLSRARMKLLV